MVNFEAITSIRVSTLKPGEVSENPSMPRQMDGFPAYVWEQAALDWRCTWITPKAIPRSTDIWIDSVLLWINGCRINSTDGNNLTWIQCSFPVFFRSNEENASPPVATPEAPVVHICILKYAVARIKSQSIH